MLLLVAFALASVVGCWVWGDFGIRTKCLFTLLYASSWAVLFIPFHSLYLFPLGQCAVIIIVGGATFGADWLMRGR